MSRYCVVKTQFKDQEALIDALMETGAWKREQIEVHSEAQNLFGYKGDQRSEVAHIIIRKKNVGSMSNDLGFVLDDDGNYRAIISEYDSSKYGKAWVGQLTGNYAYHKTNKDMCKLGRKVSRERCPNGRQRITVTGYR